MIFNERLEDRDFSGANVYEHFDPRHLWTPVFQDLSENNDYITHTQRFLNRI